MTGDERDDDLLEPSPNSACGIAEEEAFLSDEEVCALIRALSIEEYAKLNLVAKIYERPSTPAEDLVQEAVTRLLERKRRCKVGVPVMLVLAGTIRSIASSGTAASNLNYQEPNEFDEVYEALWSSQQASPEQAGLFAIFGPKMLSNVEAHVADSALLTKLVEALKNGLAKEEILKLLRINEKQYRALKKQLSRKTRHLKD